MANNYRMLSALIKLENPEQVAWCTEELMRRRLTKPEGDMVTDEEDLERGASLADFDWTHEDDGLVVFSEEYGDTNHVAEFVQAFLTRYEPAGSWWMSWADTCSSPRINEFSGGALFVTATKIKHVEAQAWAARMTKAHDRR